jgi:hypothetical protein
MSDKNKIVPAQAKSHYCLNSVPWQKFFNNELESDFTYIELFFTLASYGKKVQKRKHLKVL